MNIHTTQWIVGRDLNYKSLLYVWICICSPMVFVFAFSFCMCFSACMILCPFWLYCLTLTLKLTVLPTQCSPYSILHTISILHLKQEVCALFKKYHVFVHDFSSYSKIKGLNPIFSAENYLDNKLKH